MMHATPLQSIRKYCLHCHGNNSSEVTRCREGGCCLYPYRLNTGRVSVKVIKKFCLECMNEDGNGNRGAYRLVKKCPSFDCHLRPYRLGKNPNYVNRGRSTEDLAVMRLLARANRAD